MSNIDEYHEKYPSTSRGFGGWHEMDCDRCGSVMFWAHGSDDLSACVSLCLDCWEDKKRKEMEIEQ